MIIRLSTAVYHRFAPQIRLKRTQIGFAPERVITSRVLDYPSFAVLPSYLYEYKLILISMSAHGAITINRIALLPKMFRFSINRVNRKIVA